MIFLVLLSATLALVAHVVIRGYRTRKYVYDLQKRGLPMPQNSWLGGHLLLLGRMRKLLPKDATVHHAFADISEDLKQSTFYLDLWPVLPPLLLLNSPLAATQLVTLPTQVKIRDLAEKLDIITGGPSLLTMHESPWKRWRNIFSPGFNPNFMLEQTPKVVAETQVLCQKLVQRAQINEPFRLNDLTTRLTMEIIGIVAMDAHFNFQHADTELPSNFRVLIENTSYAAILDPINHFNPFRVLAQRRAGRAVDRFIQREIRKTFAERRENEKHFAAKNTDRSKSVLSLALDSYLEEEGKSHRDSLDPHFLSTAASQLRMFMLAGHDTTASSMSFLVHNLYTNPKCLEKMRAEHAEVFGADPSQVAVLLNANPVLLNRIPYTAACIKESLRLFPPGNAFRMGHESITLTDEEGRQYPTSSCQIYTVLSALHRNPKFWVKPDEFIPERFLVTSEDPLYPVKGAWRPFEHGPRNCLGQTLAMSELKVFAVLVVRSFDFTPAYEEWDESRHIKSGPNSYKGDRCYMTQVGGGAAGPSGLYPCRVRVRD